MKVANQTEKDKLALLISLIFVTLLAVLAFRFINKANQSSKPNTADILADSTSIEENPITNDIDETETLGATTTNQGWVATDYTQDQIQPTTNYTVKSGDTLWELAEAVYGDGSQWTKILEANAASVGYLPNGEQALIQVGQTLVIPELR